VLTATIFRDDPPIKRRTTIILHGSITQKTALNIRLLPVKQSCQSLIKILEKVIKPKVSKASALGN
jgi:hypothetical protein